MVKKCIPCSLKNNKIIVILLIVIVASFAFFAHHVMTMNTTLQQKTTTTTQPPQIVMFSQQPQFLPPPIPPRLTCNNGSCMNYQMQNTRDIFNDPYVPPVKREDYIYRQIGILTETSSPATTTQTLILPLMGKQHINGRDKWNYYTISNTGALNTKLPIKVKGKSCSFEYGCDELFNGDVVVVEGYNQSFKTTIYENNAFNYTPMI